MEEACRKAQKSPNFKRGETVEAGQFLRNLKKDHVSKLYAKDSDEEPLYGRKINTKQWKDAQRHSDDLSVNEVNCIRCDVCSIALQANSSKYYHVAEIDLFELNELLGSELQFVAQYKPVFDSEGNAVNLCHFELMPLEQTVDAWLALDLLLGGPFPDKMPQTPEEHAKARRAADNYCRAFDIRMYVRRKDGVLPAPSLSD